MKNQQRRLLIIGVIFLLLTSFLLGSSVAFFQSRVIHQSVSRPLDPPLRVPPSMANTTIDLTRVQPNTSPWLGFGVEWDAETNDVAPLTLTQAQWQTLYQRIDYMRPAWIRSMINIKWFCPSGLVGRYAFDSSDMQGWYPILNYAQAHHILLMFGTWDTGPWNYTSDSYATAIAALAHYLIQVKGYTNIRYFSGLNEPDTKLSSFQVWETATQNIQRAFARFGLNTVLSLVGPDTSWTNGWVTNSSLPWSEKTILGAYEWHDYDHTCCDLSNDQLEQVLRPVVRRIHSADINNKPILLGEMGWAYQMGPGDNQYQVMTYQYGLQMADYAFQLAGAGFSGGSAWDLDDAMHNKIWGMWNILESSNPRPWFYSWALLSRYLLPTASIYSLDTSLTGVRVLAAQMHPADDPNQRYWTVALINRGSSGHYITLHMPFRNNERIFQTYRYSENQRLTDTNKLPVPVSVSAEQIQNGVVAYVPANSMILLTNLPS